MNSTTFRVIRNDLIILFLQQIKFRAKSSEGLSELDIKIASHSLSGRLVLTIEQEQIWNYQGLDFLLQGIFT